MCCNAPFCFDPLISVTVPSILWTAPTWGAATQTERWFTLLPTRMAAQLPPQNTWLLRIAKKLITLTTTTVLCPVKITAVSPAGCQTAVQTTPGTQKTRSTVTRTLIPFTTGDLLYQTSVETWRCSVVRNLQIMRRKRKNPKTVFPILQVLHVAQAKLLVTRSRKS